MRSQPRKDGSGLASPLPESDHLAQRGVVVWAWSVGYRFVFHNPQPVKQRGNETLNMASRSWKGNFGTSQLQAFKILQVLSLINPLRVETQGS